MSDPHTSRHDAYCEFMRSHRETVWRICWRYAQGDSERCRDMVQEVWIALWLRFDRLRENAPEAQKQVWIWRTARSVLIDLYRRQHICYERLSEQQMAAIQVTGVDYAECIEDMKESLNEGEQRLLQMRLDGYNVKEISSILGIERNAVYQRVNRIINKLKLSYGKRS